MAPLIPLLRQATPIVVDHACGSWISATDGVDYLGLVQEWVTTDLCP